jgi:hypothetical protein
MKYRLLALSGLAVSLSLGAAACSSSSSSPAASGATSSTSGPGYPSRTRWAGGSCHGVWIQAGLRPGMAMARGTGQWLRQTTIAVSICLLLITLRYSVKGGPRVGI